MVCVPRATRGWSSSLLWGLLLGACQGDSAPAAQAQVPLEGDTPCERWQYSMCKLASRCSAEEQACLEQYESFACGSARKAESCAEQLSEANCGSAPSSCDYQQVADPTPAVAGCERYVKRVCQSAATCKLTDLAMDQPTCEDSVVDCSTALGLTSSFATCMAELETLNCTAWALPEACVGTVILL